MHDKSASPAALLESQWVCQQLLLTFMQMLDCGNAEGAAALLAPNARWNRQGQVIDGAAAIRAVIAGRAPNRVVRHHLCNLVVTLRSCDSASAKAYYAAYLHEGAPGVASISGPERVGDYHAEFVRTAAGWRVSYLRAERLFKLAARGERDG